MTIRQAKMTTVSHGDPFLCDHCCICCMQSVVDTYVACAYTENVFLHCWASVAWGTLMLHKMNDLLSLDHFQSHLMVVLSGTKNYSFINMSDKLCPLMECLDNLMRPQIKVRVGLVVLDSQTQKHFLSIFFFKLIVVTVFNS